MNAIARTIEPVTHDLGAFTVRRAVPQAACRSVGPFVFVDQFGPASLDIGAGMDVRPHPHIGLATVTYLVTGAIDHRDSLGTFATIRPGEVNLMTAGKGIVHSERSPADERAAGPRIFGMQTWLALPDGKEEIAPAFENVKADALPTISDGGATARVIMGAAWGEEAPTTCHSPTLYADILLSDGGKVEIDAEADERAVMLIEGNGEIGGQALDLYRLAILAPGDAMTLSSRGGGRVILLGGAPLGKRTVYWNFVHSSKDRIEQAKEDWRERRFAEVPGDDEERIPLPDQPNTVSYP